MIWFAPFGRLIALMRSADSFFSRRSERITSFRNGVSRFPFTHIPEPIMTKITPVMRPIAVFKAGMGVWS